jgi:D-beta-D-heptose 7-phosphate kinase/D-beta-D-heptose 1-phosphate adenosyltransferase
MTLEKLKEALAQARLLGEKIVLTNGCFDLLHAGHVAYLQEAKKLGSRLIVAVNDDASIKRLKGETRPVVTLELRVELLAALAAVDWVIAFSEDTPEVLIHELKPEVLVKGGDYQPNEVVGAQIVRDYGGDVCVVQHPFTKNCSTTQIIAKKNL